MKASVDVDRVSRHARGAAAARGTARSSPVYGGSGLAHGAKDRMVKLERLHIQTFAGW